MSTAGYLVEGLTCGKCVAEVLGKVRSLSGVTDVALDLNVWGRSPLLVMSGTKVGTPLLREAVESAGFALLPPRRAERGAHAGTALRPRRATPVQIVKDCCLPSEV